MDTLTFPIRVTVFREDNGEMPTIEGADGTEVSQENVTAAISNLNNVYAAIKVKFVQEGPVSFIDNSTVLDYTGGFNPSAISFTSSNCHLMINPLPGGIVGLASSLDYFPDRNPPYNYYSPNFNGTFYIEDSTWLASGPTVAHEMGHVLGLRHTFGINTSMYDNPYDPIENSPMIFADRTTRELVIRNEQPDGTANILVPNHETAGDRISDTPAWGRRHKSFPDPNDPDCFKYIDSIGGAEIKNVLNCSPGFRENNCNYTGNYVDYNGHELTNTDVGTINFMSYTNQLCRNNFTEDQLLRQSMIIREDAVRVWNPSKGTHFVDSVQFWHTTVPVKNANILFRHEEESDAEGRYSQITTASDGSFSAKLFDSSVKVKSVKLGRGARTQGYVRESDTSYAIYDYTANDWAIDITTSDLVSLIRYILGIESLNSFQKLSADVNRDGKLDVFDIVAIRRIILGLDLEFSDYPSGPWQFVPEVVSQSSGFSNTPFNMTLDGTAYNEEAPYIRSDFFFTPVPGETTGFDAYKLGDVNGSSMARLTGNIISPENCPKEGKSEITSIVPNTFFSKNASLKYQISPTSSKNVSGFQVEIEFDNTKLELLEKQVGIGSDLFERAAAGIPTGTMQNLRGWSNELVKGSKTQVRLSYVFDGSGTKFSQKIDPNKNMLELVFKTKVAGANLSEAITLGTGIPFEVYQTEGCVIREDFVSEIVQEEKSFSGAKKASTYKEFSLTVSPNPVMDKATLIIKSEVDEQYEVTFYSMTTGEKIRSLSVKTTGGYFYGNINTEDLPKDVLLVKVKSPDTSYSTKLIKL